MSRPITATYRLQFTPEFGFQEARELVSYLHGLGVSHVYASPIFVPRPGSAHGYDVIDPTRLNPALGEEADFEAFVQELTSRGMGIILDIVPNHMAATTLNPWWNDVLEHGPASRYAGYFDINWDVHPGEVAADNVGEAARIVLPTLGDHFGRVLENGELSLVLDQYGFAVRFYEHRFPLDPSTWGEILVAIQGELERELDGIVPGREELDRIIHQVERLPDRGVDSSRAREERASGSARLGSQFWRYVNSRPDVQRIAQQAVNRFNGMPGNTDSFNRLEALIDAQPWRLAFWRRASEEINYRRFFDIADLVSLRTEDSDVFDAVHSLLLELAGLDGVDGFRADHVDGLRDPMCYAARLRSRLAELRRNLQGTHHLLVEKILTGDERIPLGWQVDGTTGYEFSHRVNALLVHPDGFERIERHYCAITGQDESFHDVVLRSKELVLDQLFHGEFERLADDLYFLGKRFRAYRDLSRRQLGEALCALVIAFPVYRTYIRAGERTLRDVNIITGALENARIMAEGIEPEVWQLLDFVLLGDWPEVENSWRIDWVERWQQFTGPLMAKGLEDTALYAYTPLLSLNEVGGEPESISAEQFHEHNRHIAARWPGTMLTTSTHDTKRSEDVRARIGVLSELADAWLERLDRWREYNAGLRSEIAGVEVPDANEEQFVYQTLLGAWPLDPSAFHDFRDRVKEYLVKAMREAKIHSSWIDVNESHEAGVLRFVDQIMDQEPAAPFLREIAAFQTRISSYGAWNSLSQLVLKLTSPGFPDVYQGTELWDFSLADPDNRRPVDYDHRQALLNEIAGIDGSEIPTLVQQWRDGRVKLLTMSRLLGLRRRNPDLFLRGDYTPLDVQGELADHVLAFERGVGDTSLLVAVPRWTASLVPPETPPVGEEVWRDTAIVAPSGAPGRWHDVVSDRATTAPHDGRHIRVADMMASTPYGVWISNR